MKYSIQDKPRFQRGKKLETREVRRKRLKGWAGLAGAMLKRQGKDPKGYSEGKLALLYYRRSRIPIFAITANRFKAQGREALLKSLEA